MALFGKKKQGAAPESKLKVSLLPDGESFTFLIEGRLDTLTSPELESRINEVISSARKLVLDLGKLEYISSAGLRVLLGAAQQMEGKGEMVLTHVTPEVREIFDITGFIEVFNIQ